jgi:hypothetical protein
MFTTHIRFQEVTRKKTLKVKCRCCNKKRSRTLSTTHTVNPYNTNEDGSVKSYGEVCQDAQAALDELVTKWSAPEFTILCDPCKKKLSRLQWTEKETFCESCGSDIKVGKYYDTITDGDEEFKVCPTCIGKGKMPWG